MIRVRLADGRLIDTCDEIMVLPYDVTVAAFIDCLDDWAEPVPEQGAVDAEAEPL